MQTAAPARSSASENSRPWARVQLPIDSHCSGGHAADLGGDGLGVALLEQGRAGASTARPHALAGSYLQEVGAQARDLVLHGHGGAVADRDHRDHRADANDDAQDGEEGAHQVAPDRAQRQQQGVEPHAQPAPKGVAVCPAWPAWSPTGSGLR
jgi:hypothetical protein